MDELLKELMSKGFMLWEVPFDKMEIEGSYWTLVKESTPMDSSNSIPDAPAPFTNKRSFATYDEALNVAKKMIGYGEPTDVPPPPNKRMQWRVSAKYDRGLGSEYQNITMTATSHKIALSEGRKNIEAVLSKHGVEPDAIGEVTARPVHSEDS